MESLWLAIAFVLGFGARFIKLPPLVGYLVAGFILHYMGAEKGELIKTISDLGIMLLLFTIGLKLKIKTLARKEIWAGTAIQMLLFVGIMTVLFYFLSFTNISYFKPFDSQKALLLAFAFSFSSTVFAAKVLEEKGELTSFYGIMAIGILIIQDLFAVAFMVFETGELPNIYALGIPLVLIFIRPVLFKILNTVGHGELLILFGFFLAFIIGAELFHMTGLKPDLGALVAGMLIANHKKAKEMADTLLGFKDIFLIGFFLSIGLSGMPTLSMLVVAIIVALTINLKVVLYFLVLTRFKLRARTAIFTSLSLANFSEFGLIITSLAVASGWLSNDWLIIMALSLSISFVISSPLNINAQKIYASIKNYLLTFETSQRLTYDKYYDIGNAEILVFGMGRIGRSTYDQLKEKYGKKVLGLDYDENVVLANQEEGRNIIQEDATDSEFWQRIPDGKVKSSQVKIVVLCMDQKSNLYALERLKAINYKGMIASTAEYTDELQKLKEMGVHLAFDQKAEAGMGFANHICENMDVCNIK
ncbi:MAG: cation:proton antiporter family protein [Bacteroidales bacterium]